MPSPTLALPAADVRPGAQLRSLAARPGPLLLLLSFALLVCIRMPQVTLEGRLWAEEGTVFLRNALTLPWQQALFKEFGGYLNIVANGAGLLAADLVPLEWAPRVTFAIALAFQMCPPVLLVTSRAEWLQRPFVLPMALLLVLCPAAGQEIWLNTIHSQFHLALCAGIILALEPRSGAVGGFRAGLLLLAPLSGPASIAVLPLYLVRLALLRPRPALVETAALVCGAALQLGLFYSSSARPLGIAPGILAAVICAKHVILPFLGFPFTRWALKGVSAALEAGAVPYAMIAVTLIAGAATAFAVLKRGRVEPAFLFLAGALIAVVAYTGGLGAGPQFVHALFGARYAYVPQVLFALGLLCLAATGEDRLAKVARVLCFWLIVVGSVDYAFVHVRMFSTGPNWAAQVAQWRHDPTHVIAVWPQPDWNLKLAP